MYAVCKTSRNLTPRIRKINNKYPNKNNSRPPRRTMILEIPRIRPNDSRDDKMADCHSDTAGDENCPPAQVINP